MLGAYKWDVVVEIQLGAYFRSVLIIPILWYNTSGGGGGGGGGERCTCTLLVYSQY